jgi:hypothetical protein
MCTPTPKNWLGYQGFKEPEHFPLRGFERANTSKELIGQKIKDFTALLAIASDHYAAIVGAAQRSDSTAEEIKWLHKLLKGGNLANFLPLLVASRIRQREGAISTSRYIELIKVLETYLYRVFLFEGKRSNAGKSRLYSIAHELFEKPSTIDDVITELNGLINHYSPAEGFIEQLNKCGTWYHWRRLLRYTLHEYELSLLEDRMEPKISWEKIDDSTLEHILPQTPKSDSQWLKDWTPKQINTSLHDIGNICLTLDNSKYGNKDFIAKKGNAGNGYCYANSDIRQEREISTYPAWTPESFHQRRQSIVGWIRDRWAVDYSSPTVIPPQETEDEDNE